MWFELVKELADDELAPQVKKHQKLVEAIRDQKLPDNCDPQLFKYGSAFYDAVQASFSEQVKEHIEVAKDSMVTLSSWFNGQTKVQPKVPANAPFPLPYSDNFDSYKVDQEAKDGGAEQDSSDRYASRSSSCSSTSKTSSSLSKKARNSCTESR